jgi:hypothetical protein
VVILLSSSKTKSKLASTAVQFTTLRSGASEFV